MADRVRAAKEDRSVRILAALAVAGGAAGGVVGVRVGLRGARLAADGARLVYAATTLRLYRRCPDCRRWLRGDAAVCWRCGWRRPGRRWPRARRRF
jgi:hypothetical protein